ncbi:MAG: hypothetical protein ROZ37_02160 [Aromatoleum sp.]|jgi:hypothetical protein|nr:hypothetical protein [Aromatoleum sp.]MDT3669117.1 hypothetical protein [Aromatoleum sp.]
MKESTMASRVQGAIERATGHVEQTIQERAHEQGTDRHTQQIDPQIPR